MLDILLKSGILGLWVILSGLLVFVVGIVVLISTRNRGVVILWTLSALVPLAVGIGCTVHGRCTTDRVVETIIADGVASEETAEEMRADGYRVAPYPTYIGVFISSPLLLLGLLVLLVMTLKRPEGLSKLRTEQSTNASE